MKFQRRVFLVKYLKMVGVDLNWRRCVRLLDCSPDLQMRERKKERR